MIDDSTVSRYWLARSTLAGRALSNCPYLHALESLCHPISPSLSKVTSSIRHVYNLRQAQMSIALGTTSSKMSVALGPHEVHDLFAKGRVARLGASWHVDPRPGDKVLTRLGHRDAR